MIAKKGVFFTGVLCALFMISCQSLNYRKQTIAEQTRYYEAYIQYPQFDGYDTVNERIEQIVLVSFDQFKSSAETNWIESNRAHKEMNAMQNDDLPPFGYSVIGEQVINNNRYISVLLRTYNFTGGAHGMTTLASVTYDKTNNTFLTITDINDFTYEQLAEICQADLQKQLSGEKAWYADGASADESNYRIFTYDGKTLTVYFEPYAVAPYAAGVQQVQIAVPQRGTIN